MVYETPGVASSGSGDNGWASEGTGCGSRQVPVERILEEILGRRELSDIDGMKHY